MSRWDTARQFYEENPDGAQGVSDIDLARNYYKGLVERGELDPEKEDEAEFIANFTRDSLVPEDVNFGGVYTLADIRKRFPDSSKYKDDLIIRQVTKRIKHRDPIDVERQLRGYEKVPGGHIGAMVRGTPSSFEQMFSLGVTGVAGRVADNKRRDIDFMTNPENDERKRLEAMPKGSPGRKYLDRMLEAEASGALAEDIKAKEDSIPMWEAVKEYGQEWEKNAPKRWNFSQEDMATLGGKGGQVLGSMGAFVTMGLVSNAIGGPAATAGIVGGFGAAVHSGDMVQFADEVGATPEERERLYFHANVLGALEMLPIGHFVRGTNQFGRAAMRAVVPGASKKAIDQAIAASARATKGIAKKTGLRHLDSIVKGAALEGSQEFISETYSNFAKSGVDPEIAVLDGGLEAALGGAFGGAVFGLPGAAGSVIRGRQEARFEREADKFVRDIRESLQRHDSEREAHNQQNARPPQWIEQGVQGMMDDINNGDIVPVVESGGDTTKSVAYLSDENGDAKQEVLVTKVERDEEGNVVGVFYSDDGGRTEKALEQGQFVLKTPDETKEYEPKKNDIDKHIFEASEIYENFEKALLGYGQAFTKLETGMEIGYAYDNMRQTDVEMVKKAIERVSKMLQDDQALAEIAYFKGWDLQQVQEYAINWQIEANDALKKLTEVQEEAVEQEQETAKEQETGKSQLEKAVDEAQENVETAQKAVQEAKENLISATRKDSGFTMEQKVEARKALEKAEADEKQAVEQHENLKAEFAKTQKSAEQETAETVEEGEQESSPEETVGETHREAQKKRLDAKNEAHHEETEAIGELNRAEQAYEDDATPENKKALDEAKKKHEEAHERFMKASDAFDEGQIDWESMPDEKLAEMAKNDPDETIREDAQKEIEAREEIARQEKEGPTLKKGLTREQLVEGLKVKEEELADLKKKVHPRDPDYYLEKVEWTEKQIAVIRERLAEMEGETPEQQAELENDTKVAAKQTIEATFGNEKVIKAAARGAEAHKKALTAALKKAIKEAIKQNKGTPLGENLKGLLDKGQLNEVDFDDRFFSYAFAQSMRIYNAAQAEQQKQEIRERAGPALDTAMGDAKIDDPREVHAFSLGWWHSINGKNRSNLPTGKVPDELHETLKRGFDAAQRFKEKNPDAFRTRGQKHEGVGPILKRMQDLRFGEGESGKPEGLAGEISKFLDEMLKITRADVFNPVLGEEATPGALRALEAIRHEILSPRDFITMRSGLSILEGYGRRSSFKGMLAYFILTGENPAYASRFELQDWATYERNLEKALSNIAEVHERMGAVRDAFTDYVEIIEKHARSFDNRPSIFKLLSRLGFYENQLKNQNNDKATSPYKFDKATFPFRNDFYRMQNLNYILKSMRSDENEEGSARTRKKQMRRPKLDHIERKGLKDHRGGRDISFEELAKTFNFGGARSGRWVTSKQEQDHLNYAYDAFMDLAETIGVEPSKLGFGGKLHIAFGALGHSRHSAHYQNVHPVVDKEGRTQYVVQAINLTNTTGDGAIAHEYTHAIDFMFRNAMLKDGEKPSGRSMNMALPVQQLLIALKWKIPSIDRVEKHLKDYLDGKIWNQSIGKRRPIDNAQALIRRILENKESFLEGGFIANGGNTDFYRTDYFGNAKKMGNEYWARDEELIARAGEAAIFDFLLEREAEDNYLVSSWVAEGVASEKVGYKATIYPENAERQTINKAFRIFFDHLDFNKDGYPIIKEGYAQKLADMLFEDLEKFVNEYKKKLPESDDAATAEEKEKLQREADEAQERRRKEIDKILEKTREEGGAEEETAPEETTDIDSNTMTAEKGSEIIDQVWDEMDEAEQEKPLDAGEPAERKLVNSLVAELRVLAVDTNTKLESKRLFELADFAYGGTQAQNAYSVKQAYDAMEVAAGIVVKEQIADMPFDTAADLEAVLQKTWDILQRLPTQSKRTSDQVALQQFSTPMPLAIFMAWLANISPKDIVLEPSAGTGILANMASVFGPEATILNEYDNRRAALLLEALIPNSRIYTEDAKHLNSVLPDADIPTVVVANPPFSANAKKRGKNDIRVGMEHVEQALKRVAYGGRVVVLLGESMGQNMQKTNAWWAKISKKYRVRVNIGLTGDLYRKFGTGYDNQVIVIDKLAPDNRSVVSGDYKDAKGKGAIDNLVQAAKDLEEVRNERIHPGEQFTNQSDGQETAEPGSVSWGEGSHISGAPDDGSGAESGEGQPGKLDDDASAEGDTGESNETDASGVSERDTANKGDDSKKGKKSSSKSSRGKSRRRNRSKLGLDQNKRLADAKAEAKKRGLDLDDNLLRELDEANQELADDDEKMYSVAPKTPTPEQRKKYHKLFEALWKQSSVGRTVEETLREVAAYVREKFANLKNELKLWWETVLLPRLEKQGKDDALQNESISIGERKADTEEEGSSPFRTYEPLVEGLPHPGHLVESRALAGVDAPKITYTKLKSKVLEQARKDGRLSAAQMETVLRALTAFEEFLPNGERKGFMSGDGTGLGKAREIIGVLLEVMAQGHKKHVVISAKKDNLFKQFQKDYMAVTGASEKEAQRKVRSIDKWKSPKDEIKGFDEGILYTTYATFAHQYGSGQSSEEAQRTRVDQLKEWLGPDFDGTIVFDETHRMGNAVNMGGRQGGEASLAARAGLDVQAAFPKARIMYLSATAARDVEKLSFATRLGLWGEGTMFTDIEDFVTRISGHASRIGAMELVSQNMKALGVYLARSLGYDGVVYNQLEHELSAEQEEQFNKVADAWMGVYRKMDQMFDDLGITGNERTRAVSNFWNRQLDFFQVYTMSLAAPSMIKDIEQKLEQGGAVVIQLTRTMEAALDREVRRLRSMGIDPYDDATEVDTSPMPILMDLIEKTFPIYEFEDYVDKNGNPAQRRLQREKRDEQGERIFEDSDGDTIIPTDNDMIIHDLDNDVHVLRDIETGEEIGRSVKEDVINQDALKTRDELLRDLAVEQIAPDSLIDQIINHFGKDRVAEATGREKRVGMKDNGVPAVVKIPTKAAEKEAKEFQDGKRDILIFSSGSATGLDFHASLDVKNQKKRYHYIADMGWNVTTAVQGMGRTHRSNQAQPPEYILVHTNLKAQKRFTSIIARRLNELGALTSGQREAGNKGIISAADNLNTDEAKSALLRMLQRGNILNKDSLKDEMAIKAQDSNGRYDPAKVKLEQFQNRMFGLHVKRQNEIFEAFIDELDRIIAQMIEDGNYDQGITNLMTGHYKIESLEIVNRKEIWREGASKLEYLNILAHRTAEVLTFENFFKKFVNENNAGSVLFARNKKSGRIWAFTSHRGILNPSQGTTKPAVRRFSPTNPYGGAEPQEKLFEVNKHGEISYGEFKDEWEQIDNMDEAKKLWDEEYNKVQATVPVNYDILTGTVLPVWDRLPSQWDLVRVRPDDGVSVVGLRLPDHAVTETLQKFGVDRSHSYVAADVEPKVLQDNVVHLANGWKIKRSKVSNDYRMELLMGTEGRSKATLEALERAGMFTEIIQHKVRVFIPLGRLDVVEKLLEGTEILDILPSWQNLNEKREAMNAVSRVDSTTKEEIKATEMEIVEFFNRMAPNQTRLKIKNKPLENTQGGLAIGLTHVESARTIIEMMRNDAPFKLIHHEVIHALRNLFTMSEWTKLMNHVHDNKWLERYDVEGRWPGLYNDGRPSEAAYEEAIAEGFAEWAYDIWLRRRQGRMKLREAKKKWGKLFPIFIRMVRVFDAIAKIMRSHGIYHAKGVSDILEKVSSGEIGDRVLANNPTPEQIEAASVKAEIDEIDSYTSTRFNAVGNGKMVFSTDLSDTALNKKTALMMIKPKNAVIVRVPGPVLHWGSNTTQPHNVQMMKAAVAHHTAKGADAVIFVSVTPSGIKTTRSIIVADPSIASDPHEFFWEDINYDNRLYADDQQGKILNAYLMGEDIKPPTSMGFSARTDARDALSGKYKVEEQFDDWHTNEDGTSLDLYHGTGYPIKVLDPKKWAGENTGNSVEGTWLSNDELYAQKYARSAVRNRKEKGVVKRAMDTLKYGAARGRTIKTNIRGNLLKVEFDGNDISAQMKVSRASIEKAQKEGYDGVWFHDTSKNKIDEYLIFDPKNIRIVGERMHSVAPTPVEDPRGILRELSERTERQKKEEGGPIARIIAGLREVKEWAQSNFTRQVVGALPNLKEFHRMRLWLGQLKENLNSLPEDTMHLMAGWFKGMDKDSFMLFSQVVILEDALWDFKNERVHFLNDNIEEGERAITQQDIESLLGELHTKMGTDPAAQKAYSLRTIFMNNLRDELVAEGVLTPSQVQNKHWFRHFIVRYNTDHKPASTGRNLRQAFFHGRDGTYEEYMLDVMKVDYLAINIARKELAKIRTRKKIRQSAYDVRIDAIEMAEEHRTQAMMDVMAEEAEAYGINNWGEPKTPSKMATAIRDAVKKAMKENKGPDPEETLTAAQRIYKHMPTVSDWLATNRTMGSARATIKKTIQSLKSQGIGVPADVEKFLSAEEGNVPFAVISDFASDLDVDGHTEVAETLRMNLGFILAGHATREKIMRQKTKEEYIDTSDMEKTLAGLKRLGYTHIGEDETAKWKIDDLKIFQPDSKDGGKAFYMVTPDTLTEEATRRIMSMLNKMDTSKLDKESQKLVEGILKNKDKEVDAIMERTLRGFLLRGRPKEQMIVHEKIYDGLMEFSDAESLAKVEKAMRKFTSVWKPYILLSPAYIGRYTYYNFLGDSDALIALMGLRNYNHYLMNKEAIEAAIRISDGRPANEMERAFMEQFAHTSGQASADLLGGPAEKFDFDPRDVTLEGLMGLAQTTGKGAKKGVDYWTRNARHFNIIRENWMRYAAFRYAVTQIETGKNPEVTAGFIGNEARQAVISKDIGEGLRPDVYERAGEISLQTLVAYGRPPRGLEWMRNWSLPFGVWRWSLFMRYLRAAAQAARLYRGRKEDLGDLAPEDAKEYARAVGAKLGTKMLVNAAMYSMIVTAITEFQPFGGDEEEGEELPGWQQRNLALDLGGGVSLQTRGALHDFMGMFGLTPYDVHRAVKGDMPEGLLAHIGNSMLNSFYQTTGPIPKIAIEQTFGRTGYPDVANSRNIDDRSRHVFQSVGAGYFHDLFSDLGYGASLNPLKVGKTWSSTIFKPHNYEMNAYHTVSNEIRSFNKHIVGKPSPDIKYENESETNRAIARRNVFKRWADGNEGGMMEAVLAIYEAVHDKEADSVSQALSDGQVEKYLNTLVTSRDPWKSLTKKERPDRKLFVGGWESLSSGQKRKYEKLGGAIYERAQTWDGLSPIQMRQLEKAEQVHDQFKDAIKRMLRTKTLEVRKL